MLSLLKICNFALIDELTIEFGRGLNLLTGETGSGKSIIVDSLAALTGERVYSELIKEGAEAAEIEGLFELESDPELAAALEEGGIDAGDGELIELIVRRQLSRTGRNRIYVNGSLVTQAFLKAIGPYLADIHGQGEQTSLFSPASHLEILDRFARVADLRENVDSKFRELRSVRRELEDLRKDEAEKLQLIDILRFQLDEISAANVTEGEEDSLEEEKARLANTGKLSALSSESYALLYENDESAVGNLGEVLKRIRELARYDSDLAGRAEELESAFAVFEDLAFTLRDYASSLEFSPERLEEIETRLAELDRLKRKYGGSIETVIAHRDEAQKRLDAIETAEETAATLEKSLKEIAAKYSAAAGSLSERRKAAASEFESAVEEHLKSVALEKARFRVNIETPEDREDVSAFTSNGFDAIEFLFSANPGESPKLLSRVASGGEASRLSLILKTAADGSSSGSAAVFDEIDAGIGGRVAEAVGKRLKSLSLSQQVLCVTHQPQVASLADAHFVVEKESEGDSTSVSIRRLGDDEKIAEIARMLAGETVSETAREHAKEMLKAASSRP